MGWSLLLACSPEDEAAPLPTSWSYEERESAVPQLTTTELEGAVSEVVDALLRVDPSYLHDAFSRAAAAGDDACPLEYEHASQPVVSGDCASEDGYTYYGLALLNRKAEQDLLIDGETHYHHTYDWTTGFLRVLGPDGYLLEVLGDDLYRAYIGDDGDEVLQMYLWGDFYVEGSAYAETWLGEHIGVQLYLDAVARADGNEAVWSGGLSRLGGVAKGAVVDDLVVSSRPGACVREGVGTIQVYDLYNSWYTVVFDGDVACDGCGFAWADGVALGPVCADLSPLAAWEGRPW
jgi:hypothetical protein